MSMLGANLTLPQDGHVVGRRGKTGGLGRVLVESIGFAGQMGHGLKWVIFKRVNWVTG